jgi:hypothetical protein
MNEETITPDMRVWTIIQRYPQTFEVFHSMLS